VREHAAAAHERRALRIRLGSALEQGSDIPNRHARDPIQLQLASGELSISVSRRRRAPSKTSSFGARCKRHGATARARRICSKQPSRAALQEQRLSDRSMTSAKPTERSRPSARAETCGFAARGQVIAHELGAAPQLDRGRCLPQYCAVGAPWYWPGATPWYWPGATPWYWPGTTCAPGHPSTPHGGFTVAPPGSSITGT
jgi:hypothetical protein